MTHQLTPEQYEACRKWAEANNSDPFAYARAVSDYRHRIAGTNGIDYEVTKSMHAVDVEVSKNRTVKTMRPFYSNMKRP